MKKGVVIGLICGFVLIALTLVFIFIIKPSFGVGKFAEKIEDSEESIFENIVIEPPITSLVLEPGENIIRIFEIINNDSKTIFLRCGIYNKYASDKYAPQLNCRLLDEETASFNFIEIPAGGSKKFSIETKTEKDSQYMTQEGTFYSVTTNTGSYEEKILIEAGRKPEVQDVKEVLLSIIVE